MTADLDAQVRRLVTVMLSSSDFHGRDELVGQATEVRVTGGPVTMLALDVGANAPRSAFDQNRVPGTAWVNDADGNVIGTLVLWTQDGFLSALEHGWVTEEPPSELPGPEQVWFESA